jgi:hypothetical protein
VLGCRRAQEREAMLGCAGEVKGERDLICLGSGEGMFGWRIGEMNALTSQH